MNLVEKARQAREALEADAAKVVPAEPDEVELPNRPAPQEDTPPMLDTAYAILPLDRLLPDPNNRDVAGEELEGSIRRSGVLQPLLVEPDYQANGGGAEGLLYRIVDGHRRYAGAGAAGVLGVPCIIREAPQGEAGAIRRQVDALVANLERKDLTPLEEAAAYQRLIDSGLSQVEVSEQVGRSQGHVSKRLALLKLPAKAQELIASGAVTLETGQLLTKLGKAKVINEAIKEAEDLGSPNHLLDAELRSIAENEIAELEEAAQRKEAAEALEAQGLKVVPHADTVGSLHQKGPRVLGKGYGKLSVYAGGKQKDHVEEPCHAVYLGHNLKPVAVCMEPDRHKPKGESKLKAKVDDGSGAERNAAEEELDANVQEAAARRLAHIRLVLPRPSMASGRAVIELVVGKFLAGEFSNSGIGWAESPSAVALVEVLGIDSDDLATPADASPAELLRTYAEEVDAGPTRLAAAIVILQWENELDELGPHPSDPKGPDGCWREAEPYFRWLERQGYKLDELEERLLGRTAKAEKSEAKAS